MHENRFFSLFKALQAQPWLARCHRDQERSRLYSHRIQPTWWAFLSLSLFYFLFFCGCMSCHLGMCRVVIDGPPCWCADRTPERKSVLLSVRFVACSTVSTHFLVVSLHIPHSLYQLDTNHLLFMVSIIYRWSLTFRGKRNKTLCSLFSFFSQPFLLTLVLCGHRQRCSGG